jgi:hypothetical protein
MAKYAKKKAAVKKPAKKAAKKTPAKKIPAKRPMPMQMPPGSSMNMPGYPGAGGMGQ